MLHAFSRRVLRAIKGRQRLAAEDERHRMILHLHDDAPGFADFVGVSRTDDVQMRNGAQRHQLLDGLMRRAVFADADGIVREDVSRRQLHQR